MNLQILNFDKHSEPPPPPLQLPQRPAEVRTETKVSQGAIIKIKAMDSGVKETAGWVVGYAAVAYHRAMSDFSCWGVTGLSRPDGAEPRHHTNKPASRTVAAIRKM